MALSNPRYKTLFLFRNRFSPLFWAEPSCQSRSTMQSTRPTERAQLPAEFLPTTRGVWRRYLVTAARVLVVVVIFFVIFKTMDVAGIAARLTAATALAFAAGVLLFFGQAALCTVRWRLLAEAGVSPPGFADSYRAFLEGAFFNEAIPSTLGGDAWRVVRWRGAGLSLRAAAASVLMDRLSGAMGAAILAIVGSLVLSRYGLDTQWALAIFALGLLALVGVSGFVMVARWRNPPFRHLTRLHAAVTGLQTSLVVDRRYLGSLVYSIAGHGISGLVVYLVALSLSVDLSFLLILSVTAAMSLVVMIPISLAGWGMREASFIALLTPFGVNNQDALLIGILFGLMGLVSSLAGGVSFLAGRRTHRSDEETAKFS
jgi:glycosyltransferase 2 family protein